MKSTTFSLALAFIAIAFTASPVSAQLPTGWRAHDLRRPAPPVVDPGTAQLPASVPSDAIVLFDGTDLSQWRNDAGEDAGWRIVDGAMESVAGSGYVFSREEFGDCQVHVEWAAPAQVKGNGQGRGNSGVFLMGIFEVQVLDSYENETYYDGSAGSIYGQFPPLVNASRKPGEWQSYDIVFIAPRFDEGGNLTAPAKLTVLHNGVVIQAGEEPFGPTAWIVHDDYTPITSGPLSLQDHGNPVRYRNIWVRKLSPRPSPETPYPATTEITADQAERLVGKYGDHEITWNDNKLYFVFGSRKERPLEMVLQQNGDYAFRYTSGKLTFDDFEEDSPQTLRYSLDAAGKGEAKRKK